MDGITLRDELRHFTGTEEYHLWNALFRQCVLTDGALYLAKQARAFWLMDIIGSYQRNLGVRSTPFQVWKLTVQNTKGIVTCEDGNYRKIVRQVIPYTDFPLEEVKLYAAYSDGSLVVMLPSEY